MVEPPFGGPQNIFFDSNPRGSLPVEEEATSDSNRVDTRVAGTSAHLRIVTQGSLSRLLSTEDRPKNLSSISIFSKCFIRVVAHAELPGFRVTNQEETTSE